MLAGYVMSKVCEEDINDDNTLSGMIMNVGCSGMAVFGMFLLMYILCWYERLFWIGKFHRLVDNAVLDEHSSIWEQGRKIIWDRDHGDWSHNLGRYDSNLYWNGMAVINPKPIEEQGREFADGLLDTVKLSGAQTELRNPEDAFLSGTYFGAVQGYKRGVNLMLIQAINYFPDIYNKIVESNFDMTIDWQEEFKKMLLKETFGQEWTT